MIIRNLIATKFLCILFLLNSCTNIVTIQEPLRQQAGAFARDTSLNAFYPLERGNSWTYELSQFQDGVPNNKFKEMTMAVTERNEDSTGISAVIGRSYPDTPVQPNKTLARIFTDRIELSRYVQQTAVETFGIKNPALSENNSISILKMPLAKGNSWEGRVFQGGKEKITVVGMEKVTVPAGTFEALKVNHHLTYDNGKEDNLFYWYALNTGTVKMHEEITILLAGRWVKLKSVGVLKNYRKG